MFGTAEYTQSQSFRGDRNEALGVARSALLGIGFEITRSSDNALEVRGPGMNSNREPPLRGATEIAITVRQSEIGLQARLGGVARMKWFLYLFPPGLLLVLFAFMGPTLDVPWTVFLLPIAPWIVLSPLIARGIERRTVHALDGLLRSMAVVGT